MALRTLVVDDEPPVHDAIRMMVDWRALNYQMPDSAADGAEALAMMRERNYDVIITDICMPNMSGLEFMRETKRLNQKVQILVITAYAQFSYAQEALRLGARDLFLKPLDRHELEACLRAIAAEYPDTPQQEDGQNYKRDELYQKLLDTLNDHFQQDISVRRLAEEHYVSSAYLGQYFKRMSGTTIHEYINRKRIDWIKMRTQQKNVYVQKIIADAGYKNSGYFYRVFQKMEGMSFAEWRDSLNLQDAARPLPEQESPGQAWYDSDDGLPGEENDE